MRHPITDAAHVITDAGAEMRLSPLEVATGVPFGLCDVSLKDVAGSRHPRAALDSLIRPALLTPPCVLGFSGGRDSSALLASALDLARREGLPEPIPITL